MRTFVVALLALVAVGLSTQPAAAHSDLKSSTPAANSTITTAPAEITMTFVEVVRGKLSTVVVTGPDGAKYGTGKARAVDRTLHQPVKPLISGKYTVAWRIVSADGHTIQGAFTFTANLPQPSPSPSTVAPTTSAASPEAAEPSAAAASSDSDSGGNGTLLAVAGAGLLVLVVGIVALARRRRTA